MDTITITKPDDFHLHLREGDMCHRVIYPTARQFKRGLIMPNTKEPILDAERMIAYRADIQKYCSYSSNISFEPLMTIQITESTTPAIVIAAKEAGAIAGKIYPRGMTTNSENGVMEYTKLWPVLKTMENVGLVACFHGESPEEGLFCLDREEAFLTILEMIVRAFPQLKVVMEHVTTQRAVDKIQYLTEIGFQNVAATITVHHLVLTLNDVIGGKLQPHNFCKPVAKREMDRKALINAVWTGDPRFFLGTDSAPHLREDKECASGCAGVYSAPVAMPLLAEVLERYRCLERLEPFCSHFGADFYGLPRNTETLTLVKESWVVPREYTTIVPFWAGKEISWKIPENL
jgi:dihydroorotase